MNGSYILSQEYEIDMHHPHPVGFVEPNEAEEKSASYLHRHHTLNRKLGAWRWRGLYENRERLVCLIEMAGPFAVDYGGASGPLGLGSTVVDIRGTTVDGDIVKYRRIVDLPFKPQLIFSSHTLEHTVSPELEIEAMAHCLRPGGWMVLNLPHWSCVRWRAAENPLLDPVGGRFGSPHWWTFGINNTDEGALLYRYVAIAPLVRKFFRASHIRLCGDNSIWVEAIK